MSNHEAGAQFATNSHQTTIDLQAGIIASQQKELDRLNILAIDYAAEIERLNRTIGWYQGEAGKMMGAAAKVEAAALAAPSEQAEPRRYDLIMGSMVEKSLGGYVRYLDWAAAAAAAPAGWREAMQELVDLVESYLQGEYEIDSFTLQPCLQILAGEPVEFDAPAAAPAAPLPAQPEQLQQDHVSRLIHKAWNLGLHADHHGFDKFKAEIAYGAPQPLFDRISALQAEPAGQHDADLDTEVFAAKFYGAAPLPELTDDEKLQRNIMLGMADCMDMVRTDLIEMGIIDKTVAPMFIPEAVANYCQRLAAPPSPAPAPTGPLYEEQPDGTITEVDQSDLFGDSPVPTEPFLPARRFINVTGFLDADYVEFAEGREYGGGVRDGVPHESKHYTRAEAEKIVRNGAWREVGVPTDTSPASRMGGITSKESAESRHPIEPISRDVAYQALSALGHAMTICDGVPTRAHLSGDSALRYLGMMVNYQEGTDHHGYRMVQDALTALGAELARTDPGRAIKNCDFCEGAGGWGSGEDAEGCTKCNGTGKASAETAAPGASTERKQ